MERNFLSRYNNKIESWSKNIKDDPDNKDIYETEMSDYIIKCLPYMKQYTDDIEKEVTTDNVFNCKETSGFTKERYIR